MARVIVYLRDQERNALHNLAQREYRTSRDQAALIIRTELERLGLLATTGPAKPQQEAKHEQYAS